MSTTTITRTFTTNGVPTDMVSVVFGNQAGTIGVRRIDTGAMIVPVGTPLVHTGVGTYAYTITDPAPNLVYNYWVEFVYAGEAHWIEKDIAGGTACGGAGTVIAQVLPESCVSLARYAEIMELNENAFWGLNDGSGNLPCDHIWTQQERKRIARYLAEAQAEIEQVVGYPLCPRWIVNEAQPYAFPVHTRWGKVIEGGFRNTAAIAAGAAVNYATDPAVIGPLATTVTDADEIHVFYPGSVREITPDNVTLSGGFVTIQIPWARLVDPAYFNNPADGLDYNDATIYAASVDVTRVYNDDSIQAGLIWPHRAGATCDCGCSTCGGTCGEYSVNGCLYVRNAETGAVDVLAANYASGAWSAACPICYCGEPDSLRLNYRAGLDLITLQVEDMVVRLAHSKMPWPPCGCDLLSDAWKRDRNVPDNISAEREMNPFGPSDGAWHAWRQAVAMRLQRGMVMG